MTPKRSLVPGFSSGATSARGDSDAQLGPAPMRARLLSLLVRPTVPPLALGLVVAVSLLATETLLGYLLRRVATEDALGVVYLPGVLVIALAWGFWLAAATSVASTLAVDFFLVPPVWSLTVAEPRDWMALAVFLVVALLASTVADVARRAALADQRHREAELTAELGAVVAEQQAALRRVATLVARGATSSEVFSAVTDELAQCLGAYDHAVLFRYEPDGTGVLLAAGSDDAALKRIPVGERFSLDGESVATRVFRTGQAARMDSYQNAVGSIAIRLRDLRLRTAVGAPIIVEGRLWGAAIVGSTKPEPLPPGTEARVGDFADLVATAIANAQTRAELGVLAEQQAALRRVATLVARGVSPSEVFEAVADEMARCLRVMHATVSRYDVDAFIPVAIYHGDRLRKLPERLRLPLEGDNVAARVFRSGHTARMDSHDDAPGIHAARIRELGIRSAVGVPILVDGRLWGAAIVGSSAPEPLPPDTEARIADFADLVTTAIANAATRAELHASRDELGVLAEQQAALRRVATLVARGTPPPELFAAVADELAGCLHAGNASVNRFEGDEVVVLALSHLEPGMQSKPVVGERHTLEGNNIATRVLQTGRPARLDSAELRNAPGSIARRLWEMGLRCTVAVPIIVDQRVWGMAAVGSLQPEPLPSDTEARMSDFADLVATAIANAVTRAELISSRARIVAAADDARRHLERDLHDGAQQRLVALGLQTRLAAADVPPEMQSLRDHLSGLASGLTDVSTDLQEISRGIHPAILSQGGLGPALKTLARRSAVPVELNLDIAQRLPGSAEVAAYYVVAETLTNAAKHAEASVVEVCVDTEGASLQLSIRDDGIGGADTAKGSGLIGLIDRVEALGGTMAITSKTGAGTSLHVNIPFEIE
jgi:signal transduction histidine kinase